MKVNYFKPGSELTFKSVVNIRDQLYRIILDKATDKLCLDLSEVIHCDSAGLALLIEAKRLCKKNNKSFAVTGMSEETRFLADFCGVKEILEVV